MKKTFNVDEKLLREAKSASGADTATETIRLGLEALVRHAAYQELKTFAGSEPHARFVKRRRERPSRKPTDRARQRSTPQRFSALG